MVKGYLSYELEASGGSIAAESAPILHATYEDKPVVVAPTPTGVQVWDLASGSVISAVSQFRKERAIGVSGLSLSPDGELLAVGFEDGAVGVYEFPLLAERMLSHQHRLGRSVLVFGWSAASTLLASGGQDTDVIVWDVTSSELVHVFEGHQRQVSGLFFLDEPYLISTARDGKIHVWNTEIRATVHTVLTSSSNGIFAAAVDPTQSLLLCGSKGKRIYVYDVSDVAKEVVEVEGFSRNSERENHVQAIDFGFLEAGSKRAKSKGRKAKGEKANEGEASDAGGAVAQQQQDADVRFAVYGAERHFELWRYRGGTFKFDYRCMCDYKIRSLIWLSPSAFVLSTKGNTMEYWLAKVGTTPVRSRHFDSGGHRGAVMAGAVNEAATQCATGSTEGVIIWNFQTMRPVGTLPIEHVVCVLFLPGKRTYLAVGTDKGEVSLYHVEKASLVQCKEKAHDGGVTSLALRPGGADSEGILTTGKDKQMIIWDFVTAPSLEGEGEDVNIEVKESVELSDTPTASHFSPDGSRLAVSLQDNTVKVFFADTLKFSLSLYGHSLPVSCMGVSADSILIATGGLDKHLKIWGTQFGDVRKSIHAHDEYITALSFVANTHFILTTSRDRTVKYWDADRFLLIHILRLHTSAGLVLVPNAEGTMVLIGGEDGVAHMLMQSQEQVFPSEQAEIEEEQKKASEDLEMEQGRQRERLKLMGKESVAGYRSLVSWKASERLQNDIKVILSEQQRIREHREQVARVQAERGRMMSLRDEDDPGSDGEGEEEDEELREEAATRRRARAERLAGKPLPEPPTFTPNLLLFGRTPEDHFLRTLDAIKSHELPHVISMQPLEMIKNLLQLLEGALRLESQDPTHTEVLAKAAMCITKQHISLLRGDPESVELSDRIWTILKERLEGGWRRVSYNLAAMSFLQRRVESEKNEDMFSRFRKRRRLTYFV